MKLIAKLKIGGTQNKYTEKGKRTNRTFIYFTRNHSSFQRY